MQQTEKEALITFVDYDNKNNAGEMLWLQPNI